MSFVPTMKPVAFFRRTVVLAFMLLPSLATAQFQIQLSPLGTYKSGIFDGSGAEIVAHDPNTQRLFVVNGAESSIDVLDLRNPTQLPRLFVIDLTPYGKQGNSVDVREGIVAVAVENVNTQEPGVVVFFDVDGNLVNKVTVGALPDMLTFTPDGRYLLVANEGEPNDDYTVDPEGTISIIDLAKGIKNLKQGDVRTADFRAGIGFEDQARALGIRIFGPGANAAQDAEPEYIAVSADSRTAYVVLQENNAIAVVDIRKAKVTDVLPLGYKDHSLPGNGLDASDRDNAINIAQWPVRGLYLPDAIAAYEHHGDTFLVTANEGDAREYTGSPGYVEEARIRDLQLDPVVFPNAEELQQNAKLGRLKVTQSAGDANGDGTYEALYTFGARSFSIWAADGRQVYDSGDDFERITAALLPNDFNSNNDENDSFDSRSDDKGPEPEGLALGRIFFRTFAFIGLERVGGIMVYDITNPYAPKFIEYVNNRNFSGDAEAATAGDLGPEGLIFVPASESPTRKPLLVVANEISGTTTVFGIDIVLNKEATDTELTDAGVSPVGFALQQNYPNPFNPETVIPFQIAEESQVTLRIFNTLGQQVSVLVDARMLPGSYTLQWDGRDESGRAVPSGTYLYRLEAADYVSLKKMSLVR